ncbi:MAG: penicillin-binding transpeptidase domain-containing protein, partial [Bacteroidota bacterium]
KRQPGSTFKPFVYTAAIDNGYSPYYMLPDSTFTYEDPQTGQVWAPRNFGGPGGGMMTLADALAESNNVITARVITQLVDPAAVAFYARRMGIKSQLDRVPSLGLGVSDVSLLEMTAAYSTLANGGLYHEPTVVTRIEDRFGNVLYEAVPAPQEALSEATAYTVVDMMRGAIQSPYGTAQRVRHQFGLGEYDLAAKTGTTQESADGWFMLMHPELVTGAWVGFNDRRIAFRSQWWGQGAHNALFLVGDFMRRTARAPEVGLSNARFPSPEEFGVIDPYEGQSSPSGQRPAQPPEEDRRVGW